MNVYVNTVRSVDDELKRAVFVDIPLMAGTYGAMATESALWRACSHSSGRRYCNSSLNTLAVYFWLYHCI